MYSLYAKKSCLLLKQAFSTFILHIESLLNNNITVKDSFEPFSASIDRLLDKLGLVAIRCQFCLLLVDKEGCACHRNGFLVLALIIDAFLKQVYMQQCM